MASRIADLNANKPGEDEVVKNSQFVAVRSKTNKIYNLPVHQATNQGSFGHTTYKEIQPASGSIGFDSTFEFVIPKEKAKLTGMYLRLNVTVTPADTNSSVKLLPTPLWIEEVSVDVGGYQTRTFGDTLLELLRHSETEPVFKQTVDRYAHGLDKSDSNDHTRIVASDQTLTTTATVSKRVWIPLKNLVLDTFQPIPALLNDHIRIKVVTRATGLVDSGDSNDTDTAVADGALELEFLNINKSSYAAIASQYSKKLSARAVQVQRFNTGASLTASAGEQSRLLSGVHGNFVALSAKVASATAPTTYATLRNWGCPADAYKYSAWSLEDESGTIMTHNRSLNREENAMFAKNSFPDDFVQFNIDDVGNGYELCNHMFYSQCTNLPLAIQHGLDLGNFDVKDWTLKCDTDTDGALTVYGFKSVIITVENGNVSITD